MGRRMPGERGGVVRTAVSQVSWRRVVGAGLFFLLVYAPPAWKGTPWPVGAEECVEQVQGTAASPRACRQETIAETRN